MVHGPCGELNPAASCMRDGRCTKGFPKAFQPQTEVPQHAYPKYRRRSPQDGGQVAHIRRRGVRVDDDGGDGGADYGEDANRQQLVDNTWIVPYNPYLSRLLEAHVNVEVITYSFACIKYVIKYIKKGGDQVMCKIVDAAGHEAVDEVATYQNYRYLGAMEAA